MSLFHPQLLRSRLTAATKPTWLLRSWHPYSTPTATPDVVLPRLQADLKTALRSKNKPMLNTIRALQAEIINASKTPTPIETDCHLYKLLLKQIQASESAIQEFKAAKREDLVTKEQEQLSVLQSYLDEIPTMPESELDELIKDVVEGQKEEKRALDFITGQVMKALKGKPVSGKLVKKRIEEVLRPQVH